MNKKIATAALIVMWLSIATASAAIVDYLSNTVELTINVQSPLEVRLSADDTTYQTGTLDMGTMYGGETLNVYIKIDNRANATIGPSNILTTISNNINNASCSDFVSASINGSVCNQIGNQAQLSTLKTFNPLEKTINMMSATFIQTVAPATYTVSTKVIPT